MSLTVGGALAIGSAALAVKPIWDGYKWVFPSAADIEQKAGNLTVGPDGLVQVTPEFAGYYGRSSVDTDTGKSAQQYVQDLYNNRIRKQEKFRYDSPEAQALRDEKARQRRLQADQTKYDRMQDALARTDQMIALERADNLERWTREQQFNQRKDELGLRRDQMENNIALQRLDLLDRQGRQDWQQQQFEKQLVLDEEQRVRDQRKFYALLGQSLLSEGGKMLFS